MKTASLDFTQLQESKLPSYSIFIHSNKDNMSANDDQEDAVYQLQQGRERHQLGDEMTPHSAVRPSIVFD